MAGLDIAMLRKLAAAAAAKKNGKKPSAKSASKAPEAAIAPPEAGGAQGPVNPFAAASAKAKERLTK